MNKFFIIIFLIYSPLSFSVIEADFAKIIFSERGMDMGAVLYENDFIPAKIVFYNETGLRADGTRKRIKIREIKINLDISAAGLLVYIENAFNFHQDMTFGNIDGKTLHDLLGNYWGGRLGAGFFVGGKLEGLVNGNGIFLGNTTGSIVDDEMNAGINIGYIWITIYPRADNSESTLWYESISIRPALND